MALPDPSDPIAASYPRLLGDIGGTNARWAWQAAPGRAWLAIAALIALAAAGPLLLFDPDEYMLVLGFTEIGLVLRTMLLMQALGALDRLLQRIRPAALTPAGRVRECPQTAATTGSTTRLQR